MSLSFDKNKQYEVKTADKIPEAFHAKYEKVSICIQQSNS